MTSCLSHPKQVKYCTSVICGIYVKKVFNLLTTDYEGQWHKVQSHYTRTEGG